MQEFKKFSRKDDGFSQKPKQSPLLAGAVIMGRSARQISDMNFSRGSRMRPYSRKHNEITRVVMIHVTPHPTN